MDDEQRRAWKHYQEELADYYRELGMPDYQERAASEVLQAIGQREGRTGGTIYMMQQTILGRWHVHALGNGDRRWLATFAERDHAEMFIRAMTDNKQGES